LADVNPELENMIRTVAKALGPDLVKQTAFVGGVTTGLFVSDDFARENVRLTDDVDLIVDIVGYGKWVQLQDLLRARGFRESPEDDVVCRMRLGNLKVDFMPDDEKILGFTNRWYALGLKTAVDHTLTDGTIIRILTPPLFLATKLEAFRGRGSKDLLMSRDLEDILILLDGRPLLVTEIAATSAEVKTYIAKELADLLSYNQIANAIASNMRGDAGRIALINRRIKDIVGA
jgi:hypothetical protein